MRRDAQSLWMGSLEPPISGRYSKPRRSGLTMVIDKGLGLQATRDLLETSASHLDFIKLGFGSAAVYPTRVLREKVALIHQAGVIAYPGGTFFEIAVDQGQEHEFLTHARDVGFQWIEVSDGTISCTPTQRLQTIARVRNRGFHVITEVGKKDAAAQLSVAETTARIQADLAAGAEYVIVEARESGRSIGIYRADGSIDRDALEAIAGSVSDSAALIWEAPEKAQQEALIMRFGPNVNLGNIAPQDAVSLESLRLGLRSDTLRHFLRAHPQNAHATVTP